MMKIKAINVIIISLFWLTANAQEEELSDLIKDFKSNDWEKVYQAKLKLENMEEKCIPAIMGLLDENTEVKLKNTGDLIYPGAEKFYGHGQIINYDIDNIMIRAGWLLEEVTFQNFGFSLEHEIEDDLIKNIKQLYKEYLTQKYINKIEQMGVDEIREEIKVLARKKATDWWTNDGEGWNRFQGLLEALHSSDSKQQILALQYLRKGETKCTGLTIESFIDQIKERLRQLSKSDIQRVSEQAKFVLNDTDFEFIRIKNK